EDRKLFREAMDRIGLENPKATIIAAPKLANGKYDIGAGVRQAVDARVREGGAFTVAVWSREALTLPGPGWLHRRMPSEALGAARELFAVLRDFDAQGAQQIWIEAPPAEPEWAGVRDRLQRAAAG
ncbi:MAG: Sua5 family C-terminal domain-containing protein, partial [Ramlibacter sp.]